MTRMELTKLKELDFFRYFTAETTNGFLNIIVYILVFLKILKQISQDKSLISLRRYFLYNTRN